MSDSAGQFGDAITPVPYEARRPRTDINANGFQTGAADAAAQAAANGETRILGVDQDQGTTAGQADAASGQVTQRAGIANTPAAGPQFMRY
jgi:hypothetical protein